MYVIVSEFVLALVLTIIMFASMALTKMHSNRIANYLLLPVLLGLGYINAAHYHRQQQHINRKESIRADVRPPPTHAANYNNLEVDTSGGGGGGGDSKEDLLSSLFPSASGSSDIYPLVDSIELFACNGLASLSVMLLMGNLFSRQLAKLLD